jgi:hypothetical protein
MYNKSIYDNPYRDNSPDSPSLYKQPEITDSIKKNDKLQTVEIEKGEIVAKPDLAALYKAQGKKHSGGGIPTYVEPNSFIYSDDKSLAFTKEDHELMELKLGGTTKRQKNTPAEVLKRNVDVKHYNRLINNLEDPIANDITKKSSALMLAKYQESLGKIAFIQEAKKQFQDGIPDFAADTAPVYDANLKKEIKEQPQYMKYGGQLLPKMARGGNPYDDDSLIEECPCGRNPTTGKCNSPCSDNQIKEAISKATLVTRDKVRGMNLVGSQNNYTAFQQGTNPSTGKIIQTAGAKDPNWAQTVKTPAYQAWLRTPRGQKHLMDSGQKSVPGSNDYKMIFSPEKIPFTAKPAMGIPGIPVGPKINFPGPINPTPKVNPAPELKTQPSSPYNPEVGMSFDQTLNLGYSALQAASVKRYDPMRSQIRSTVPEFEQYNVQGAINQIQGSSNNAFNASRTLNPYLANAANQETLMKTLDATNSTYSQYDERNRGVANQQAQATANVRNGDLQANLGFDAKYYDQTVASNQNFDDLKSAANNETVGLWNRYRGQNRQLQEFLSQQPIAGSVPIRDKNGKIVRYQDMPLYGYDSWKGNTYKTEAGNIMNSRTTPQQSQYQRQYAELMQKIIQSGDARAMAVLFNSLDNKGNVFTGNAGTQYKKGGRVNPYN